VIIALQIGIPISFLTLNGMPSIALGVCVAFMKQPALPSEAPQTKENSKKILKNKNH
jgi:hypothetical protein